MIKDVDGLSRHIDIRIHHYLTQSSRMCLADLALRPFSYSFYWFNSCYNPCRVTTFAITITTEASSTLPPVSIIHHSPILFTFKSIIQSYSVPKPISHTFHHISPQRTVYGYLLTQLPPL